MFDITLTFDNGPEPEVTPGVLDTLARAAVPATFFVLGAKLMQPDRRRLAERAAAEGHWIGNHTYSHAIPLGKCAAPGTAEDEIGRTQAVMGSLSHPDRLFRPFGDGGILGHHLLSPEAAAFLAAGGYTCVLWNCVPRDWENTEDWPERVLAHCYTTPWTLAVIHDLPTGAMAQLDRFIAAVRDAGGRFRQDFPPDCVPLRRGKAVLPMDAYVASPASGAAVPEAAL